MYLQIRQRQSQRLETLRKIKKRLLHLVANFS
jgi:hypothetical protein